MDLSLCRSRNARSMNMPQGIFLRIELTICLESQVPFLTESRRSDRSRGELPNSITVNKVLVVDDEEPLRFSIRTILETQDYDVVEASNGNEAIAQVDKENPDLVIMDIIMPGKEGFETILQSNEEYPEIRIIAMSGGGRLGTDILPGTVSDLNDAGTLQKSFRVSELFELVHQALPRNLSSFVLGGIP